MELGFRLFGLPVRVSLFFLLVAVIIRPDTARGSPALIAAWVVVMFLGVLLHEMAHALTARAFGQQPAILLHGFGGVTYWLPRGEVGAGRRLLISAAGPAVGIVVGGVLLGLQRSFAQPGAPAHAILDLMVQVNLWWAILNLLPMLPLDGGQVLASFLELLGLRNGRRVVHWLSLVTAGLLVAVSVAFLYVFGIVIGGLMAYSNWVALRPAAPGPPEAPPSV